MSMDEAESTTIPSWWAWQAVVDVGDQRSFVYGCAAECKRAPTGASVRCVPCGEFAKMHIAEAVLDASHFSAYEDRLEMGQIDSIACPVAMIPSAPVKAVRDLLLSAFGSSCAQVRSFHTLAAVEFLEVAGLDVRRLLTLLSDELGLPFLTTHVSQLGAFEVFDLQPWLEKDRPFELRDGKRTGTAP